MSRASVRFKYTFVVLNIRQILPPEQTGSHFAGIDVDPIAEKISRLVPKFKAAPWDAGRGFYWRRLHVASSIVAYCRADRSYLRFAVREDAAARISHFSYNALLAQLGLPLGVVGGAVRGQVHREVEEVQL